jgi:hypothetical protein
MILRIDGHRSGAAFRGHGIDSCVLAVHFFDDAERAIAAVRAEGQTKSRVEAGSIDAWSDLGVATTLKLAISVTAIILLLQAEKSFLFLISIANPEGPSQGAREACRRTAGCGGVDLDDLA